MGGAVTRYVPHVVEKYIFVSFCSTDMQGWFTSLLGPYHFWLKMVGAFFLG